jgi:hypothetical protein
MHGPEIACEASNPNRGSSPRSAKVAETGALPLSVEESRGRMEVDLPDVKAEVVAAFARYEAALMDNDIAALDALFRDDPRTIRYGGTENLYGMQAIRAFRRERSPVGLRRRLAQTVITTYGRDFATAATLFYRDTAPGKVGRQMQSWVRFPQGWRVVAAHV